MKMYAVDLGMMSSAVFRSSPRPADALARNSSVRSSVNLSPVNSKEDEDKDDCDAAVFGLSLEPQRMGPK